MLKLNSALKISRILHAGYVFEYQGTQIAFDPIFEQPFSRNCFAFPEVRFDLGLIQTIKFDAIFISHFHDDHCSLESLNLLDRNTPIYMYCVHEEIFQWIRQLGFSQVFSLRIDMPVQIGRFEVIPRRALDADVDSMFQVKSPGANILNVVDSWIDDETMDLLARQGPWDLVLWPFQTMRELEVLAPTRAMPAPASLPAEWMEQLKILKPKFVVPSSCQFRQESWSWYNKALFPISYRQFQEEIERALPTTEVVRMDPSTSFDWSEAGLRISAPLPWVLPQGDQNVDYEFEPNLEPTSTSEIARHFAALTPTETESVLDYCRVGLLEKFRTLELSFEDYFLQPRYWQLSVFDHTGHAFRFYYLLHGESIKVVAPDIELLSWSTEIPMAKLFAALNSGESLTSIYVRINSDKFNEELENTIGSVDIVEDPLVRCLFNGQFGSYQKAQLKSIQERVFGAEVPGAAT